MKNPDRPTDPVIARRFAEATFLADNRADLAKVSVPSLLLQCSDDMVAPIEVGTYRSGRREQVTRSGRHGARPRNQSGSTFQLSLPR